MNVKSPQILFSAQEIAERVTVMADRISREFASGDVVLVGVLKGAFVLLADLMRKLSVSPLIDFIWLSSYGNGTMSSGKIEILKDLRTPIDGKDVIIVEDIIDTGLTLRFLKEELAKRQPRSLRVCVLLDKRFRREVEIEPDYMGFILQKDLFVVGYGLDCAERYRHLPGIHFLEE